MQEFPPHDVTKHPCVGDKRGRHFSILHTLHRVNIGVRKLSGHCMCLLPSQYTRERERERVCVCVCVSFSRVPLQDSVLTSNFLTLGFAKSIFSGKQVLYILLLWCRICTKEVDNCIHQVNHVNHSAPVSIFFHHRSREYIMVNEFLGEGN